MRVVFVHGACVADGSWWWHRTVSFSRTWHRQRVACAAKLRRDR